MTEEFENENDTRTKSGGWIGTEQQNMACTELTSERTSKQASK